MLPKRHRLPLRTELTRVQKEGRLYQGKLFSLLVSQPSLTFEVKPSLKSGSTSKMEQIKKPPSRFGFIISTKVHKKAVKRNRARRLLTEAIQSFLPGIKPGFKVIFLAKKTLIDKNLTEVKKEVEKVFRKAKLI